MTGAGGEKWQRCGGGRDREGEPERGCHSSERWNSGHQRFPL